MNSRTKTQRRHGLAIILLLALTRLCTAAETTAVADNTTVLLSALLEQTQVPAYSVAIVRNGDVLLQSAVGEVDNRNHFAATTEHRFRLASVSKAVGATMLALLVQNGELDPQAPISDYIDNLPEQYQELSVLQLLSHTSGLPHYQARDSNIAGTHYANAIDTPESVGDRTLLSAPGDSYQYSTHAYTILGALYESITGAPLTETTPRFVKTLSGRETPVLENLRQRESWRSNVFAVTADGAETLKPRDQSYSPFGTGLTATATDLAFFGDAVLHSSLITAETRELMFRPAELSSGGKTGTYLYEVAFGWRVGKDAAGRTVYHHAGVTEGARSVLVLYPDSGLSIAFLSNASWTAQIERTAFALANLVLEEQSSIPTKGEHEFSGSFDGNPISGTLTCGEGAQLCRLTDNEGALTEWLRRHALGKTPISDWPAMFVDGIAGQVLKLVTTVGFVELRGSSVDGEFLAEIGNGRKLIIRTGGGSVE